jgi:hypothetical protein
VKLRRDLVLVKLAPPPAVNAAGIIEAHALTPPVCYGKAVQVGARCHDVAAGDIVFFPPSAGDPLDGFPTPHLLIPEADIWGKGERTEAA